MDRRDLNLETSILFRERKQRSTKPFLPDDSGDDAGPKRPKIDKPDT